MRKTRRTLRLTLLSMLSLALAATALIGAAVPAGAQSSNKLTVTAGEYVFQLKGKPAPGNVEIVFDNQGVEIHMMAIVQLKPGVTLKQLKQAFASDDEEAANKVLGGAGFEIPAVPGLLSGGVSTTNITNLKAGHYAMVCFVPAPDGTPHFAHGMVKLFDVKGSKSSLKPPTDGVVDVTITDSGVTLPSSGIPKSGWIKITNESSGPRDLTLAKYEGSNTDFTVVNSAVDAFFQSGAWPGGEAPVLLNGGVLTLAPNGIGYVKVTNLPSGKWVAVSGDDEEGSTPFHTDFTIS